jgi:TolB protein
MANMRILTVVKRAALAVLLIGISTSVMAQLEIEIRRGVARPVPIAIVPFAWEGAGDAPFDVAGLVAADLGHSGRFAPLPVSDMLSRPSRPTEVRIEDWRILDVDVLVIGRLAEESPGQYSVTFQLFDVLRGDQLLGFRMDSTRDQLRATSHRVADMIFERLTGIPGVFATQIAYVSEQRDGGVSRYRLIVADADGENAQVIADSPRPLMSPAWSPDGRRLAYVSFEGDQSAIYVQTLRTGTRERVSGRAGVNGAPAFSPDGRRLALTLSPDNGNLEVFMLDLATQVLTQLTHDPAIDTEPAWSADGRSIYFTSDRGGGAQVYRVAAEVGARPQRVTFEGAYNARPRVSPDGSQLAVVHQVAGGFRIAVVDPRNGLTQVLTDGSLDESPAFAPNGAVIIYATRDGNQGVLASVTTDGRIQERIASVAGDVREPVWSPFARP